MHHFAAALSFLTRLGPAHKLDPAIFAKTTPWYPLVGLIVAILCLLPTYLGIFSNYPLVQAFLYILLNFWLTRGLHWDAVADLSDAWGSNATGQKFWDIIYDSRCGAFAVMGLIFGVLGYFILIYSHINAKYYIGLILAPIFGRTAIIILTAIIKPRNAHSLGGITSQNANFKNSLLALTGIFILSTFFTNIATAAILLISFAVIFWGLYKLAKKQGGGNGDFLGSGIIFCEIATLLCTIP